MLLKRVPSIREQSFCRLASSFHFENSRDSRDSALIKNNNQPMTTNSVDHPKRVTLCIPIDPLKSQYKCY